MCSRPAVAALAISFDVGSRSQPETSRAAARATGTTTDRMLRPGSRGREDRDDLGLTEHLAPAERRLDQRAREAVEAARAEDRAEGRRIVRVLEIRSEEHTSELQSLRHLVCRLLLE